MNEFIPETSKDISRNNKYIPEKINSLEEYVPQTDRAEIILDANELPFLPSDKLAAEIADIAKTMAFNRYPDTMAAEPIREFAKVFGVGENCAVMGNGSDELISVLETGFLTLKDTIVVVTPDFSMYSFYGAIVGANVVKYVKKADFDIDFDELGALCVKSKAKMVIFSNPCNPTSISYGREKILRFIDSHDILVVVDEAYMEFCGDAKNCSVLDCAEERDNLVVLKTLSKAFGMASIRAGFAVTNAEIASALRKVKSPYNTTMFTQKVVAAALRHYDDVKRNVETIKALKNEVSEQMSEIIKAKPYTMYESDTNFLLIKTGADSKEIFTQLLARKIRIRLMGDYIRITIGSRRECEVMLLSFAEIM